MTALLELNEPLVTALQQRLTSELPGLIDQINARQPADGALLDYPVAVLDYIPPPDSIADFPTFGIQDLPSKFEDDIGSALTGYHELAVICFETEADPRMLAWKLRRYAQAMMSAAIDTRRLGDGWGCGPKGNWPGPTLDVQKNPQVYMSWTAVGIWARRDEQ